MYEEKISIASIQENIRDSGDTVQTLLQCLPILSA